MSKKDIEDKDEVASASEEEETSAETEEETESKKDDFDYKAEFEKLKSRTEKEDYTWEQLKKENKELKERLEKEGKDIENDDVKSLIQKEMGSLRQELLGNKLDKEIESITDNVYAQKLVKLNLEKYPGMSVKEAWALANAGKLDLKMKEVKKSLDANGRKGDGSGAGQKPQKSTEPQISSENMKVIQRMGLKWDGEMFSKKGGRFALKLLPNGEFEQVAMK